VKPQNVRMTAGRARAFWIAAPGKGEIRDEDLPQPSPSDVVVRAEYSGISRGTEALVFNGRVPVRERQRMRAPFQAGEFPAPVKYGYASVGVVEQGPEDWQGRRVFALHPHQTRYVIPAEAALPVPEAVPSGRAVLAANLETALNGLWDAQLQPGTRVAVVGAGTIGSLVAWLAGQMPGCATELVDVNASRGAIADALGVGFATPDRAARDASVVFHASGSPEGLELALRLAAFEATIVEMSWFGDRIVPLPLGEAFHSRRLTLRSSQVGTVAPSHRTRVTPRQRLQHAISLLADPALEVLITGESGFEDLPSVMERLASAPGDTLCHRISYV
jgi:2-desacetyl-2-hydroxyethyl bacteriochlorophyllide A dehydrogenase